MTGLTEAEFTALMPHFERAFVGSMQDRTIRGQPPLHDVYDLSLTHDGRQVALHSDLGETEPDPRNSKTGVWEVAIQGEQMDSSVASGVQPSPRGPTAPARSYGRRVSCAAGDATAGRPSDLPLLCTTEPNAPPSVRKILRSSKSITVARRIATRSKTSL